MHKEAFNRLPERFRKPTNEKLYEVLYNGFNGIDETLDSIKASRNIDNAYGKTLDLMGQNVGQLRIDEDDDLFRLLVKTRIIANLSIGDIPTMNEVLSVLVKDVFLGLQEVWLDDGWDNEPAAIKLSILPKLDGKYLEIINAIKAAGVRVLVEVSLKEEVRIEETFEEYKIHHYKVGDNLYRCGTIYEQSPAMVMTENVEISGTSEVAYNRPVKTGETSAGNRTDRS